jgi:hypothetical protein
MEAWRSRVNTAGDRKPMTVEAIQADITKFYSAYVKTAGNSTLKAATASNRGVNALQR